MPEKIPTLRYLMNYKLLKYEAQILMIQDQALFVNKSNKTILFKGITKDGEEIYFYKQLEQEYKKGGKIHAAFSKVVFNRG